MKFCSGLKTVPSVGAPMSIVWPSTVATTPASRETAERNFILRELKKDKETTSNVAEAWLSLELIYTCRFDAGFCRIRSAL